MKKYHKKVIESFIKDIIILKSGYLVPAYNLYVLFLIYSKTEKLDISITSFMRELKKCFPMISSNIHSIEGYKIRCYSGIYVVTDKIQFQFSCSSALKKGDPNVEVKNTINPSLSVTTSTEGIVTSVVKRRGRPSKKSNTLINKNLSAESLVKRKGRPKKEPYFSNTPRLIEEVIVDSEEFSTEEKDFEFISDVEETPLFTNPTAIRNFYPESEDNLNKEN